MQYLEDQTGLNTTKQIAIGAVTLGMMYVGHKMRKNYIPVEKSTSKSLNVLIIGASRGIGLSIARQFLIKYGDNVIIASSSQESIEKAYNTLYSEIDLSADNIMLSYKKCDASKPKDLENLYQFALKTFEGNKIDIVINNFGTDSKKRDYLWNISTDDIQRIVSVNLTGMLLSNKLSINMFMKTKQQTPMHIFNMCGAGSDGKTTPRFVTYGASKGGFINMMNSVNKELKLAKLNDKICIHSLSPGMCWTNMLAKKDDVENKQPVLSNPKQYWIVNALTEDVDIVTTWMVPKIRGVATMKKPKSSYRIDFLTKSNAICRIVGGLFFSYNKERFIDKNGIAVQQTK